MKKTILTLMGIALIATTALIYSCNKEENEATKENIVETKQAPTLVKPVGAHIKQKYTQSPLERCKDSGPVYCGHDIDDILDGDEICYLMLRKYENEFWTNFYMPIKLLIEKQINELLDCAKNGKPMTFHDDFNVLSKDLIDFLGTDMIPAGTYNTYVTSYKGEDMVCIEFGVIK